jgi:hypothetical protein
MKLLTLLDGKLVVADRLKVIKAVYSLADIDEYGDDLMCSSSVDFPEEYTSDPTIIALCRAIRGDTAFFPLR